MVGQVVSFAATSGSLVGGPTVTTDASGAASVTLFTDSDPSQRTITVTASAGSISSQVAVAVSGNSLKLSGPATGQQGVAATYLLSLLDSKGNGISGQPISVTTTNGTPSAATLTTAGTGQAQFTFTPAGGDATLSANGFGLTAAPLAIKVSSDVLSFAAPTANAELPISEDGVVNLSWSRAGVPVPDGTTVQLKLTRGTFVANGTKTLNAPTTSGSTGNVAIRSSEAGIVTVGAVGQLAGNPSISQAFEFVALQPSAVEVQPTPTTIAPGKTSTIVAAVRDVASNAVKNARVSFEVSGTTSGTLSPTSAVSDIDGKATTVYTATNNTSAQNGITIVATAVGTDAASTTRNGSAQLTVSGQAVRVALGTANKIVILEPNRYQLPITAKVTDAAGNPQKNANISITLYVTRYFKGGPIRNPTYKCSNEDKNNNAFLDPAPADDDANNNGRLDPNSTASVDDTVVLRDDGSGDFNVGYTKDEALWTEVLVTVKAAVNGSNGVATQTIVLPLAEEDAPNPPNGGRSKWGENACTAVN